jgi:cell division protein FtsW (lipid II flippase)
LCKHLIGNLNRKYMYVFDNFVFLILFWFYNKNVFNKNWTCLYMSFNVLLMIYCMFFNKDFPTPSDNCESVEWILSCHELGYQMSIFFKTLYQFKAFNLFFIMEFTSWKYLIPFKSYTYIINVLKNTIYKMSKVRKYKKEKSIKIYI